MRTWWFSFYLWLDGPDVVCVDDSAFIRCLVFLMNFIVIVPFIFSFLGLDFSTPFGRSLRHSFAFYLSHISLSGPFRIFQGMVVCRLLVDWIVLLCGVCSAGCWLYFQCGEWQGWILLRSGERFLLEVVVVGCVCQGLQERSVVLRGKSVLAVPIRGVVSVYGNEVVGGRGCWVIWYWFWDHWWPESCWVLHPHIWCMGVDVGIFNHPHFSIRGDGCWCCLVLLWRDCGRNFWKYWIFAFVG